MFLVVIGILSIVLACPQPVYCAITETGRVMAAVAAATLLPALIAVVVSRRTLRLLDRDPADPGRGQAALARGARLVQTTLALCHGSLLLGTEWPPLVARTLGVAGWPLVPAVLSIMPFLLAVLLVWLAIYPGDRAVRQIALETYLFRGRPVRPVWSLGQYVVNNLRHQVLFILIPMLLIVAARDVIVIFEQRLRAISGHPYFADMLLGLAAVIVALIAPEILRHVWSTRRLPNGPLRDRLQRVCQRLRMRYREILVWRTGGMIVNAAVMGVIAPLRYVLITDSLLEQLDDTKVEAVFGHEAGHVKQHHILFFLLFALISGCVVTIFSLRTGQIDPRGVEYQVLDVLLGSILLFKWSVVFIWISQRFEAQADIFGARVLTLSGLPCAMPCLLHGAAERNPAAPAAKDALCSTAAHVFGNTLNEVAVLNGIPPEARSWRHGSISARSRRLIRLAQDPRAAARAERTVRYIKAAILAGAVVGTVWAAWELRVWKLLELV